MPYDNRGRDWSDEAESHDSPHQSQEEVGKGSTHDSHGANNSRSSQCGF